MKKQQFDMEFQNAMGKLKLSTIEKEQIQDKRNYLLTSQRLLIE